MRVYGLIVITILFITACTGKKEITKAETTINKELNEDNKQKYYYVFLEANRKKLLGDINGALALYYQCLEIYPESAAAMSEISKINKISKNYGVAIKYAESAIKSNSENKWYQIDLARLYIVTNDNQKAVDVYEGLYRKYKNDLDIKYKLATLYTHVKNFKKAVEIYNELEARVGVNENLSITKQQLYLQIGNKTKAYEEIKKLIKHYPNEARYYGIIAEMYTNDNLFTKAEENYRKLFDIDSTSTIGQLSVIDFYRKKMDYENTFKVLKKVIGNKEIDYNHKVLIIVSMLNNQSEFSICNQELKEHITLLKELYPKEKDGYTLYADYLIKMNLFEEARAEIEYILENFEGNVVLWEQLLSIYSFNSNYEKLYEKSKTAIDSFPEHTIFYLYRGISATQQKKIDEGIDILKEGLKNINNNKELELDFYTYLGEAYYQKDDYKKSDYYFDLVLKSEPENLYVINNYSYYLSLREEKLEYAESISKKTIRVEPANSTYLDTYAWILFKLRKYNDALIYIKLAYENGGNSSPVIVEHYGDIQYMVGNKKEAIKMWQLSVEIGNKSEELAKKIKKGSIK